MATRTLVISPSAQDDLKNIFQYSLNNWGETQAIEYLDALKTQLWTLTEQPLIGIERSELLPDLFSFPVESHIIFYRKTSTRIEIVRILHRRQDPQRNLK